MAPLTRRGGVGLFLLGGLEKRPWLQPPPPPGAAGSPTGRGLEPAIASPLLAPGRWEETGTTRFASTSCQRVNHVRSLPAASVANRTRTPARSSSATARSARGASPQRRARWSTANHTTAWSAASITSGCGREADISTSRESPWKVGGCRSGLGPRCAEGGNYIRLAADRGLRSCRAATGRLPAKFRLPVRSPATRHHPFPTKPPAGSRPAYRRGQLPWCLAAGRQGDPACRPPESGPGKL
jgi:hypothetical protein